MVISPLLVTRIENFINSLLTRILSNTVYRFIFTHDHNFSIYIIFILLLVKSFLTVTVSILLVESKVTNDVLIIYIVITTNSKSIISFVICQIQ